jgi:hypothetical protein
MQTNLLGNLYVGGTIAIPTEIPELSVNGNLRVCANVPGFGQACDTLD